MKLVSLQKSLSHQVCPCCNSQGNLQAILRCDIDPSTCIAKAQCSICSSLFHFNEVSSTIYNALPSNKACSLLNQTCSIEAPERKAG